MNRTARRIAKASQAQLDRMRARASRRLKGMVWRGWLRDDDALVGTWSYPPSVLTEADRQALADYAEHAPFRWSVTAIARCRAVDAHGTPEDYVDDAEQVTDQALQMDELVELCRAAMAEATRTTNPNHIRERVYVIRPLV